MYYSLEPEKDKFFKYAEIYPNNIKNISGLHLSEVVGTHGICKISNCQNNLDEIETWLPELGYYTDFLLPPRSFSEQYETSLALFPDNEEILVIYNNSDQPFNCHIQISHLNLPIVKWSIKNWYDDLWLKITNHNFDSNKHLIKDVRQAINFDQSNRAKYNPPRLTSTYSLKMIPRHPMKTQCVFYPYQYVEQAKEWTVTEVDSNYKYFNDLSMQKNLFTGSIITVNPSDILILDQIMTQFYLSDFDLNNIKMYALWYKTAVRKHFNYSM